MRRVTIDLFADQWDEMGWDAGTANTPARTATRGINAVPPPPGCLQAAVDTACSSARGLSTDRHSSLQPSLAGLENCWTLASAALMRLSNCFSTMAPKGSRVPSTRSSPSSRGVRPTRGVKKVRPDVIRRMLAFAFGIFTTALMPLISRSAWRSCWRALKLCSICRPMAISVSTLAATFCRSVLAKCPLLVWVRVAATGRRHHRHTGRRSAFNFRGGEFTIPLHTDHGSGGF